MAGTPSQLNIMYGLAGERRLDELELPWLPGYENSRPVRIGNAAHKQFQLDVFGEVMDALYLGRRAGLDADENSWRVQRGDARPSRIGLAAIRTRAFGRFADRGGTSPTRKSWPGPPSIAPSKPRSSTGDECSARPLARHCGRKSTTRFAGKDTTPAAAHSCNTTAARTSTPAC